LPRGGEEEKDSEWAVLRGRRDWQKLLLALDTDGSSKAR
jgi:hypothetical protein